MSLSSRRAWIEIVRNLEVTHNINRSLSSRRAWIEIRFVDWGDIMRSESLSSRRAWIEMQSLTRQLSANESLSSRRAWIEISASGLKSDESACRSPHGERGLKFNGVIEKVKPTFGRSPHGERGLKSLLPLV